jgi:hypothetical protein
VLWNSTPRAAPDPKQQLESFHLVFQHCKGEGMSDSTQDNTAAKKTGDPDLDRFIASFAAWKDATVRFEAAVRRLRDGDSGAWAEAQGLARELAHLHHGFLESSQPYFQATGTGA